MRSWAAAAAIGALAGLALGWTLWGAPGPVVEPPAPEERRPDGSVVLERAPDPEARPPVAIPRGATLERSVTVTVQPDPVPAPAPIVPDSGPIVPRETPDTARCRCGPVQVDLALVRLADGTRRVIAQARGGTILGGVDIPVESAAPSRPLRWSAGAEYDLAARGWGGYLERDFDRLLVLPLPVRIGASITPGTAVAGPRIGARIGLRF